MTEKTFNKYKLVVDEYFVNGFNGTKAYKKFYPNATDETADSKFRTLVGIGRIESYLNEKQNQSQEALKTSHEALLSELERWAYSDITETILLTAAQIKELPIEFRRLVTKYRHTQRHLRDSDGKIVETIDIIELHFVSKEKAMEMIHKHTGFYEKDNTQKGTLMSPYLTLEQKKLLDEELNSDY